MVTEHTSVRFGGEPAVIRALRTRVRGEIVLPDDATYDDARAVWLGNADRRPNVIVRAKDVIDVMAAVEFGRAQGYAVAVRGGGHSVAGHGTVDGNMVIDTSPMKAMQIDPERRTAWVQPGLTWGEYAARAQEHGLATTSGDVATVGVGGLTLGGGIGWMVRKYGLTIDHLLSVELVTADGRLQRVNEQEHPDLFWALRGGGGNFGVATGFEFRLQPAGTIIGGGAFFPISQAKQVLRGAIDYAANAPDELTMMAFVMPAPPAPFIPQELHGTMSVAIAVCYVGDVEEGQRVVAPLRALGTPIADVIGPMPYPGMFALTEMATIRGMQGVHRSTYLREVSDETIETVIAHSLRGTALLNLAQIRVLGGAMARVPEEATAFAHRDKPFLLNIIAEWASPTDSPTHQAWAHAFWRDIRPAGDGVYVNFLEDEGEARVREAYKPATLARLAELKRRYDPTNLFRINQNISPRS